MPYLLIGARGRLGEAIAKEYIQDGLVSLDRTIYEDWSGPHGAELVSRYFARQPTKVDVVFVASGLLNPTLPEETLMRVNFHLPKNVIQGAARQGIKVITFGTVMEILLNAQNSYIRSKTMLGEYVDSMAGKDLPAIHIRLHTLFGGGQPSPFMFLGQILAALRNNVTFEMTSGRQLREYHHLADEANAIRQIIEFGATGALNLSHGRPLSLRSIAEGVFQAFSKSNLLQVGVLPDPMEENNAIALEPTSLIRQATFRDSLPAVVQYMKEC